MIFPDSSNLISLTSLLWAGIVATEPFLRRSQIRTELSSLPVPSWYPLGWKARAVILLMWPWKESTCFPLRRSHNKPMPWKSPLASKDPSHWKEMG